jgi:hypothetical protein
MRTSGDLLNSLKKRRRRPWLRIEVEYSSHMNATEFHTSVTGTHKRNSFERMFTAGSLGSGDLIGGYVLPHSLRDSEHASVPVRPISAGCRMSPISNRKCERCSPGYNGKTYNVENYKWNNLMNEDESYEIA